MRAMKRFFVTGLLLAAFIQPVSADALALYRPSTTWGHTYASPQQATTSKEIPQAASLEPNSKFVVNYSGFPDWAKAQVQEAIDVWATHFQSKVLINVDASWVRTPSNILGSARPGGYYSAFSGAPDPTLWYPSALANALAGKDLNKSSSEIIIQINSGASWDQSGQNSVPGQYDLISVLIHELAHGLGFLSTDDYFSNGVGELREPTAFDAYLQTEDGRRLSDLPSPSLELGKALTSTLYWSGPLGVAANGGEKPLMYTPSQYDGGSSVSHLDENTFSKTGPNSVMTPDLDAGEIFHQPGPLVLAMMSDLRNTPPAGVAVGLPGVVRNPRALIGDSSALVTFDMPLNARGAAISSYVITNLRTGLKKSVTSSPVFINGLKNGTSYEFSILAKNSLGDSESVKTKAVTPKAAWKSTVLDAATDPRSLVSTTFNGQPLIAYIDHKNGYLKMASWTGGTWKKTTVDGYSAFAGRTRNVIGGQISLCTSGSAGKQALHIFYADSVSKDLRYAKYNGKNFTFEVVDGDAEKVQSYEETDRVRTASDVSITAACAVTVDGIQVFYRDETQGVLLGAYKLNGEEDWSYELIDGDRKTDSRTTGDTAFHMKALTDGKKTYLLYDSVLVVNANKEATSGEIRLAKRTEIDPAAWRYSNLDASGTSVLIPGFDVSLTKNSAGVIASWLVATQTGGADPQEIRWTNLNDYGDFRTVAPENFGSPGPQLSTDTKSLAFNCLNRLCVVDYGKSSISLASSWQGAEPISSAWVVLNKVRYLAAGINGKLVLLKG